MIFKIKYNFVILELETQNKITLSPCWHELQSGKKQRCQSWHNYAFWHNFDRFSIKLMLKVANPNFLFNGFNIVWHNLA